MQIELLSIVNKQLDGKFPSFFEMMTLIALQYFADQQIDFALLETGIGGRLDATNIITPEVSVITTISLEHTDMLGDTFAKIAAEKAGIIKAGKHVVVGVKNAEARQVIKETARKLQAPISVLGEQFSVDPLLDGRFNYRGDIELQQLELAMAGSHQMDNVALAITAAHIVLPQLDERKVRSALTNAKWDGRFERIGKQIILDGAHNSEGTTALIETLKQVAPNMHYKFMYAALQDKDHAVSIALMDKVAKEMHFTQIALPRAAMAEQLAVQSSHTKKSYHPNWQQLVDQQITSLKEEELLIITGSLYFIGEVRSYFAKKGMCE